MSVRSSLVLVLGLAIGSTGCFATSSSVRSSKGDKILQPSTYVATGRFRMESANSTEFSKEKRSEYRLDARNAFLKALEVDPKYVEAYVGMARLELTGGDPAAAEATFRKAIALADHDAALWGELARCQLKQKKWGAAAASFKKASELDPLNQKTLSALAAAYLLAGQKAEALAILVRLHGEAKGCIEMARAVARLNLPQETALLLARAEELAPGSAELQQAKADLAKQRDTRAVQTPAPRADSPNPPGPPPEIVTYTKDAPVRMPPRPVLTIRSGK